jgi:hypothetical protein
MDPTPDRSTKRAAPPDDDELGALVRAVVDDWHLPPQRLDQPTWRDRVGGGSARSRRGWLVRLGAPAVTAITATVLVAFVAVWLTARPTDTGVAKTPPSAAGRTPSVTMAAPTVVPSVLPALFVDGELPDPSRVIVRNNTRYQVADLTTGTLGQIATGSYDGPVKLLPRPGGGWVCICGDWVEFSGNRPTGVDVVLETADAAGVPGTRTVLRTIRGDEDPGTGGTAQPELADVRAAASPDGRLAFVGWTVRHGAEGWSGGIDVVDLATASVISSTPLTFAEPDGADGRPSTRIAPAVALSQAGDNLLVSSFWFAENGMAIVPSGTDHWIAPFDGRSIGSLKPAGSSSGVQCDEVDRGLIDANRYFVLCWDAGGHFEVARYRVDGTPVDRTPVQGMSAGLDGGSNVVRRGDKLFLWDAYASTLSRFDLATAEVDSATGTAAVSPSGPLDAFAALGRGLGRWIAPPALAKTFLDPGIVASPDGSRIYAVGIESVPDGEGGSRGVFVFDAATLQNVDHWQPTADFVSLAVSGDGRYVYAAGMPERDAAGNEVRTGASITVFDTRDGAVRLIAGQLDHGLLTFPAAIAR